MQQNDRYGRSDSGSTDLYVQLHNRIYRSGHTGWFLYHSSAPVRCLLPADGGLECGVPSRSTYLFRGRPHFSPAEHRLSGLRPIQRRRLQLH